MINTNFHEHLYNAKPKTQTINHHVRRYLEAVKMFDEGDSVIDVGCGSGYGSSLLSLRTKDVMGIDIDGEAIFHARRKYPYIEFYVKHFSIIQKIYDYFVAFEIIEHLTGEESKDFFRLINLRCKKGFIISTPVDAMLDINHCHKTQWDEHDIKSKLGDQFDIEINYQDWETGDFNDNRKGMIIIKGRRKEDSLKRWDEL